MGTASSISFSQSQPMQPLGVPFQEVPLDLSLNIPIFSRFPIHPPSFPKAPKPSQGQLYECLAPMRIIPFKVFKELGQIPRSDQEVPGSMMLTDINNREACFIVFISHRWARGAGPTPHPDNEQHDKYKLVVEGLVDVSRSVIDPFATLEEFNNKPQPYSVEVFIWIDFFCIDQDDIEKKINGIHSLPFYIQNSDCLFTPYLGGKEETVYDCPIADFWPEYNEIICNFKGISWKGQGDEYFERSWCRLELFIGSNAALIEGSFKYFEKRGFWRRDRPHFLYGGAQKTLDYTPELLPMLNYGWLRKLDPRTGCLFDQRDLAEIMDIMSKCGYDDVPEDLGYVGGRNEEGVPHGHGSLTNSMNDTYIGEWRDGKKNGLGVLYRANGDVYVGSFKDDLMHGHGCVYWVGVAQREERYFVNGVMQGRHTVYKLREEGSDLYYVYCCTVTDSEGKDFVWNSYGDDDGNMLPSQEFIDAWNSYPDT